MAKFGKDLIEAMSDAVDHAKRKTPGRRVHVVEVPDAGAIRRKLRMSQSEFAKAYRIPLATLKGWEQGRRRPDGPAAAYLQVIARKPRETREALATK
jgi:putative transcriptional regulator